MWTKLTAEMIGSGDRSVKKLGAIKLSSDILKKAKIGLWAFELDEGCDPRMYVDETMLKLLGLTHQLSPEETYHAWYDHVDPKCYGEVAEAVEKMTAGVHAEVQYPWHHPNGDTWIVRCGGVRNYAYEKGVRIEGTHQNITLLTHLEKKNLTDLLASLADNFRQVYILDPYTGSFDSYAGNAFDGDEGRDYSNIDFYQGVADRSGSIVHPDDKPLIDKMYSRGNLISVLESGKPTEFIVRWPNGNDECVYMKNRLVPFEDEDGKKKLVIGVLDVTSEERSKKQIADDNALVEGLSSEYHTLGIIDSKSRMAKIIRATKGNLFKSEARCIQEQPDYASALQRYVNTSVFESDREQVLQDASFESVKKNAPDMGVYSVTYKCYDDNGNLGYHQMCFAKAKMSGGIINYIFGFRDVDSEIKKQLEQQRMFEEAELANRSKTTFLFNMSHDIRTPMNAISGYTAMAKKHIDDRDKVKSCLDKIGLAGESLIELINQVLEMSRIESGKIELEEKNVDLIEKINGIVSATSIIADTKNIAVSLDCSGIMNRFVSVDSFRLTRIFTNILGNAMKYTLEGGRISITAKQEPCETEGMANYSFVVKDTGIGMSREFLEHIFEDFTRERNSTTSGIQGTGLGMSIVKSLVDAFGGTIRIESEKGRGTTVCVKIPMKYHEETEADSDRSDINETVNLRGLKILLVEDNEMNLEIAKEALEECGVIVSVATDGDMAVDIMRNSNRGDFDIILMDVQMPRMNGYDATRAIRCLPDAYVSEIPIIAMTANAFEEDKRDAFKAGMNAHIAKPIDIERMKKTMESVVMRKDNA